MRKSILLTGGRALFTLDLARKLHQTGHSVYVADSFSHSVSRFSVSVRKHFTLPSPKVDDELYLEALSNIIRRYRIELLIPTCEELFFIARKLQLLNPLCRVVVDKFEKLDQLHDKYRFIELAVSLGFQTPITRKANTRDELDRILRGWDKNGPVVIKPVYSRFGTYLVVLANCQTHVLPTRIGNPPWIVQQYMDGDQYCTYSICHRGRLLAHVTYKTTYTTVGCNDYQAGRRGPGVYFISVQDREIDCWVSKFVELIDFSGQIAFDFIRRKDGTVFPIECNPRLTSGIHLFPADTGICDAFTGNPKQKVTTQPGIRRMIAQSMWYHFLSHLRSWKDLYLFCSDFFSAKDVLFSWRDPFPYLHSYWIVLYIAWRSWKAGTPFADTFMDTVTHDMSWNGHRS